MASPPASLFRTDYEKYKKALDKDIQEQMKGLYKKWASSMERVATSLMGNGKRIPDRIFLIQMTAQLRMASTQIAGEVATAEAKLCQKILTDARHSSSSFWEKAGFDNRVMESYMINVSQNVINNIASQMLIANKDGSIEAFGLSPAVWGTFFSTAKVCEEAVARGVANGLSVKDISKQIQDIIDPFKGWEDGAVYSGNTAYCAERLIKTLTQHAYQQEIVQENIDNPLCFGIKWHANGPRACEFCQAMNGRIFEKDEVPLDHPNGMCVLEPIYASNYEEMLADWRNNPVGTYPELDEYAEKVGYDLSSFDSVDALIQAQNASMDGITITPELDQGLLKKVTSTVLKGTKAVKNQFLSILQEKFDQAEGAWKNAYALASSKITEIRRVDERKSEGSGFYPSDFSIRFKESSLIPKGYDAQILEEGATFFHELGHAIDSCVNATDSADLHMQLAIGKDWDAIMRDKDLTDKLFKLAELDGNYSWVTKAVVQDGMSWAKFYLDTLKPKGKGEDYAYFKDRLDHKFLIFSHRTRYWFDQTVFGGGLKMGGFAVEAFAEFSEVKLMHPEEYDDLKALFPNYAEEYEKAITEASKRYVDEQIEKARDSS